MVVIFFVFIVLALKTEPMAITTMVSQDDTPYILVHTILPSNEGHNVFVSIDMKVLIQDNIFPN
jgi:hypothetical protein